MTTHAGVPHPARKWYGLALRHLRIASILLRKGFPDAAYFHIYHAFECAISSVIASKNFPVPPDGKKIIYMGKKRLIQYTASKGQITEPSTHKARFLLFDDLADHSKSYYTAYSILSRFLTNDDRNASLYFDHKTYLLPHEQYNHSHVEPLYRDVREFVKGCREELK